MSTLDWPDPVASIGPTTALALIVETSTVAVVRCRRETGCDDGGRSRSCGKLLQRIYNPTQGDMEFFCPRCHERHRAEVTFRYE